MTVRLVESLRRHGGRFRNAPVLAYVARFGPPLGRATRAAFNRLEVEYRRLPSHPRYAWFHYLNKVLALADAERRARSPILTFLDSDALITGEPSHFELAPDEDFAACASDEGVVGTTGPECCHDASWRRIARLLSIEVDDLPWVVTHTEKKRIRLYWNAGIYTYRRQTSFASAYLDDCLRVLDANEGFACNGEHSLDQVILGLSVFRLGLRWRPLDRSHNYAVASFLTGQFDPQLFRDARLIHYHDSMRPGFWATFCGWLRAHHPQCHEWLAPLGPVMNPAPAVWRWISEGLRIKRGIARKRYRARVRRMYTDGVSVAREESV